MNTENKNTEVNDTDKKLIISDVMKRIDGLINEYKQATIDIHKCTDFHRGV
jgi:hypothetical protein